MVDVVTYSLHWLVPTFFAYICDTVSVLRKKKNHCEKEAISYFKWWACCCIVKSVPNLDQEERNSYPGSDMNQMCHQGQVTLWVFISSSIKMRIVTAIETAIVQYPLFLSSMGIKVTIFSWENFVPNNVAFSIILCT